MILYSGGTFDPRAFAVFVAGGYLLGRTGGAAFGGLAYFGMAAANNSIVQWLAGTPPQPGLKPVQIVKQLHTDGQCWRDTQWSDGSWTYQPDSGCA